MKRHASGYKSKLRQVIARVDCWNRSVSKELANSIQLESLDPTPKVV
jgi:hypothetical protein